MHESNCNHTKQHLPRAEWGGAIGRKLDQDPWLHGEISDHGIEEDIFTVEQLFHLCTNIGRLNVVVMLYNEKHFRFKQKYQRRN